MHLIVAGLSHRSAPLALRELVAVPERRQQQALGALVARPGVVEGALLSTCNRTEVYAVTDAAANVTADEMLTEYLASLGGAQPSQFAGHVFYYRDDRAVEHAMHVASGLDSMVLGEYQILGQVRDAYESARQCGATGPVLNALFQSTLAAAKRIRTETEIGRGAFSVGAAAVELASRIFGETLSGKTVLVLGAGKMSELTARHLQARGAPAVLVANRTHERAQELAAALGPNAHARRYDELSGALLASDIVVCSTAAPHTVITPELVQRAMHSRRNRPLFLIDIAVPRDVDPAVALLPNVYLYNIDDLGEIVARDSAKRQAEIARAQQIIGEATEQFRSWWRALEVAPLVSAVRGRLDALRLDEAARLRARLAHLGDREWRAVEAALQAVTNRLAHDATVAIKQSAVSGDSDVYTRLDAIRSAFGLDADQLGAAASDSRRARPRSVSERAGEAEGSA